MKRLTIIVEADTDDELVMGMDHAVWMVGRGREDETTESNGAQVRLLVEHDVTDRQIR